MFNWFESSEAVQEGRETVVSESGVCRDTKHNSSSYHKAISTSSLARYEYTSGDILYLRFPAKMMRDLDFLRSEARV